MKIGLIGLGGFGGNAKLKAWKKVCEEGNHDLYVCEANVSRLNDVSDANNIPFDKRVLEYSELIRLVDAVDITTPAETHFEIADTALENKVNVFVEKPMTNSVMSAVLLSGRVEETGKVLQVGMHFRYNKLTDKLKEVIDNDLGELWQIEGRHVAGKRPRLDGGAILSCGIHFIDLILYLHDAKVASVLSVSRNVLKRPQKPDEDLSYVHLNFEDGLLATVKSSVIDYATGLDAAVPGINANWDFMVSGSKGRAFVDYAAQKLFVDTGYHKKENDAWKWVPVERKELVVQTENVYETELREFIKHVQNNELPRANVYSSGIIVQEIVEAAYKSARSGKEVKI